MKLLSSVPLNILYQRQQAAGVADQFVQEGNDIGEFWPMTPLLLPAVQHQLVQGHGAAHGCRQSVALFDRQNHLETQSDVMKDEVWMWKTAAELEFIQRERKS